MSTREVSREELLTAKAFGWAAHRACGEDYLWTRELGDGRAVFLMPLFGSNLRLGIGLLGAPDMDDVWCYQAPQTDEAWRAALGWDGEGEPEGWYRHPQTGRRRPGGDPAQEHVYW